MSILAHQTATLNSDSLYEYIDRDLETMESSSTSTRETHGL